MAGFSLLDSFLLAITVGSTFFAPLTRLDYDPLLIFILMITSHDQRILWTLHFRRYIWIAVRLERGWLGLRNEKSVP